MKNKSSILIPLLLLGSTLGFVSSCGDEEDTPTPDDGKKYPVDNGEVVINDSELLGSKQTDDNYRVFYEIFPGSFSDGNGDKTGDLRGIINRLDYLNDGDPDSGKSLGIEGIWLTPIFTSPTYHKYNVSNYYTIDPKFGTMDDLAELIQECHNRNIKLIIDLPINHTSTSNQWFTNFVNAQKEGDTSSPYYDFYSYYLRGETAPAGRSYATVAGTDIFYECNFSTDMPELNYDCEAVRETVLEVAQYYLDMGIDGFRFDAAKYIYYTDNTKSSDFWNWYVTELKKIKEDIYIVGEVFDSEGIIDIYTRKGLNCFSFGMSQAEGKIASTVKYDSVNSYTKYVQSYVTKLNSYGYNGMMFPFISNHDMDRSSGYLQMALKQTHMAANLYILSSGSPFIYYGEEIGMKGSRGSASSDANRRLAMRWGDDDLVKNPSEATYQEKYQINGTVADHIGDENSLLNHYKKVIMVRKANPEIARGTYKALTCEGDSFGGFISTYNDKSVCVLHNTSLDPISVDITTLSSETFTKLNGVVGAGGATLENNILTLDGMTSCVIR
ncbi:MAG: alpha-amylase family glycosyl hydrolase [Bacilli bacterium]